MFKIAICDDEEIFRENLNDILLRYMDEKGILFETEMFCSGKELVSMGIETAKYKIVFLDINMEGLDGIETAKFLRKNNPDVFIVLVTAYINYALEGYKVDAIRYILKDSAGMESSVYECIDAIREKMDYKVTWKQFHFTEGTRDISLDRILYIESRLHKLEFHVMEDSLQTYTLNETLNVIDKELAGGDFLRIHQSFLVNMKYIKSMSRYMVLLSNDVRLDISRSRYTESQKQFTAYRGKI